MAGMILLMPETDLLKLNRGVVNLKAAAHDVAELLQNLMAVIVSTNNRMTAHGMDPRG